MKNHLKIAAFAIAMFGFSAASYAQSNATATATADVVKPISIATDINMNFGRVAGSATAASTVTLGTTGTPTAGTGASIISGGTPAAAKFTVTGQDGYTYGITFPTGDHELKDNATTPNTMIVNAFTSSIGASGSTSTLTGGTQTVTMGATLNIGANQPTGVYASTTAFTVTVDYQ